METTGFWSLLRKNRNLRSLWTGQVISEIGDWFNNIAVLGLALSLTGSGLAVTGVLLSRTLPIVFFGPLAGVISDRFSRKSVMLAADWIRAFLALGFLLVTTQHRIWLCYLFACLITAVSIFFSTAKSAIIPELAHHKQLLTANAMISSTTALVQTMGGAIGGMATYWLGYKAAFILNALSFVGSAIMIYRIRLSQAEPTDAGQPTDKAAPLQHDFYHGFKYILSTPMVMGIMIVGIGWATGGGAAQILFSLFAIEVFRAGDQGIGFLYSAAGLGLITGSLAAKSLFRTLSFRQAKNILGLSLVANGAMYAVFSLAGNLWSGMLWMAASRLAMGMNQVISTTLLMKIVPAQLRGRTFSTRESLVLFSMVISMLLAGVAHQYFTTRTIGLLSGAATLLTGLLWMAVCLFSSKEEDSNIIQI